MPTIKSIAKTADGFVIITSAGNTITLTSANIPGNVKNQPIDSVQTWVNNFIASNGYNAQCSINSVTPLDIDLLISDWPIVLRPNMHW
jgi:hypothetical protein